MQTTFAMMHLSSRTTYLSVEDLVQGVVETHHTAAFHASLPGEPLPELERECHLRAISALQESLARQPTEVRTTHLQYTRLRELELELDGFRQDPEAPSFPVWTFSKMKQLFEHLAEGFDLDTVAHFLRACAELEGSFARRMSLAQQPDDSYATFVGRPSLL